MFCFHDFNLYHPSVREVVFQHFDVTLKFKISIFLKIGHFLLSVCLIVGPVFLYLYTVMLCMTKLSQGGITHNVYNLIT